MPPKSFFLDYSNTQSPKEIIYKGTRCEVTAVEKDYFTIKYNGQSIKVNKKDCLWNYASGSTNPIDSIKNWTDYYEKNITEAEDKLKNNKDLLSGIRQKYDEVAQKITIYCNKHDLNIDDINSMEKSHQTAIMEMLSEKGLIKKQLSSINNNISNLLSKILDNIFSLDKFKNLKFLAEAMLSK